MHIHERDCDGQIRSKDERQRMMWSRVDSDMQKIHNNNTINELVEEDAVTVETKSKDLNH